ncbi:SRPBCC domain-containing protein [Sneathiella sp. CAU 1612]|uniref:SRPBCC domain-containing protein n=1 Tax=Sneathiella sedimenti TaxID=2816034 RepID=A0ABS3F8X3_9PROT|nr:SRPBCC domain-containing protein [Sneathiella sedimenti]MBO0334772.1 SRPBCC domain-containing protein [Sneathiella sedimenti]
MTELPTAVHETIAVSRVFKAAPTRVFAAWTDPESRKKWEPTPEGMEMIYENFDFRPGGLERSEMQQDGTTLVGFETRFLDIVADQRIVSTVAVNADGGVMSCSLHTIEFQPEGTGTRLICHEQVAWLNGMNMRSEHEGGWAVLLERLAAVVDG